MMQMIGRRIHPEKKPGYNEQPRSAFVFDVSSFGHLFPVLRPIRSLQVPATRRGL